DMGGNQLGVEFMGHDRGSRTRYSVSVYNVTGSPEKDNAFNTPGVSGHVSHKFMMDQGSLTGIEVGGFASYATWPVGPSGVPTAGPPRGSGPTDREGGGKK